MGYGLWVNEIWARRGDPVVYRLVCIVVECFRDLRRYRLSDLYLLSLVTFANTDRITNPLSVRYGFVAVFNLNVLITPILGEGVPPGVDDGTVG